MSANYQFSLRLLIVVLAVTQGINAAAVRKHTQDNFSDHIKRVRKFPCNKPQPRAVSSMDLLTKSELLTYEHIVPTMTVLHKCDMGSGCCMQGTCTPDADEEVTLEFKIVDVMTGDLREAFVTAVNHTRCTCSDGGNHLPK